MLLRVSINNLYLRLDLIIFAFEDDLTQNLTIWRLCVLKNKPAYSILALDVNDGFLSDIFAGSHYWNLIVI